MATRIMSEEVTDWRAHTWAAARSAARYAALRRRPSFDRPGLEAVVDEAISDLRAACPEVGLPWNLSVHGPYVSYRREGAVFCSREERDEMVSAAARFAGWLRAAPELPGLRLLLRETQSVRGVSSPRTKMDLWAFAHRFPSPGRAERVFWKTKRRAEEVLRPWGLRPSWAALGGALAGVNGRRTRRVGRMALAVAADTVRNYAGRRGLTLYAPGARPRDVLAMARGLSDALALDMGKRAFCTAALLSGEAADLREAARLSARLVRDETDGVDAWLDPESRETHHGVDISEVYDRAEGRDYYMVAGFGRTYHYPRGVFGRRGTVRVALAKWRQQRVAEKAEALARRKLFPKDRTVLVYRSDSLKAGNCEAGTDAFIGREFPGRSVVPAEWLANSQLYSVRRVLAAVAAEL